MINLYYDLQEQPLQREEYKEENALVETNTQKLKNMLNDDGKSLLWELLNAQDTMLIRIAEDCYVNGICKATKFLINNILADIEKI